MSSPPDPLSRLLHSLEAEGVRADEGSFSLDPTRAAELLREQGQLGRNAPLYLLAAIYAHTDGAPVAHHRTLRTHTLSWDKPAPLPPSMERQLAEASFAAHGLSLVYGHRGVSFRSTSGLLSPTASLLNGLFAEVEDRLVYYPWKPAASATAPLNQGDAEGTHLQLFPAAQSPARFLHVLRGIAYVRPHDLPVDIVCRDPLGRPDLSLTTVPDGRRTARLEAAAEALLLQRLEESLRDAPPCRLSATRCASNLPLFAEHLAYLCRQTERPDLKAMVGEAVDFADATGRRWTAAELLDSYAQYGRMMVVDSVPDNLTESVRTDRPVLLWGGDSERLGGQLFPNLSPGAGYLHSLTVNEIERQREGETPLSELPLPDGRLSLLPWGDPDRIAEVEFVGPRRARETFYLDTEAPRGLRLLWESEHGLEESLRELTLPGSLRQTVLELLDASLIHEVPPAEVLQRAIAWASSPSPPIWDRLPRLTSTPLFEEVRGQRVSLATLKEHEGPLPTLADLSTSLPKKLPAPLLLWWHPLLATLGLSTAEWGRQVREASWQEEGRERWLAAHPVRPAELPGGEVVEGHLRAPLDDPGEPTEVIFWREGRPFGRRRLPADQCPPGFRLLWVEDDLPGDTYWSGPDPAAVLERLPEMARICRTPAADDASNG